MSIIDGRKISDEILEGLVKKIEALGVIPTLVIILVGDNKASAAYVRQKSLAGKKIGARVVVKHLDQKASQKDLESLIEKLNKDEEVHGIILQLPIPSHFDQEKLILKISPEKDVDGFLPGSKFKPATALGVIELLKRSGVKVSGKNAAVIGRGRIAGKPAAELLGEEGANVTVVHSKTEDPKKITKKADILVAAVGKPKLVTADMVKKGAVVIDVGINPVEPTPNLPVRQAGVQHPRTKIVGDVDFENVAKVASKITPVPGGVGPATVAALMQNLVEAATKAS